MIELRTGLPGNGKTLSMIQELARMQAKWDKGGGEARPVFVHNVRDLTLPHAPFPVLAIKNEKTGSTKLVPDWANVPDGSLCIIDECQDLFPPRSSQSEAPPHVAWLNTHRHRGVDLVLITQHPKLIDGAARALVGKHKHYRRMFGRKAAAVYEWDGCSDNLGGMKNATTSAWTFPADAYKWYKSAEVHTKQTFKLPKWMFIPVIGIAACFYAFPAAYNAVTGVKDKPAASAASKPAQPAPTHSTPGATGAGAAIAATNAPASAAPPSAAVQLAAAPAPRYAGCISRADACWCLTPAGEVVDNPPACRISSKSFAGDVKVAVGEAGTYSPKGAAVVPTQTTQTSTQTQTEKTIPYSQSLTVTKIPGEFVGGNVSRETLPDTKKPM